MREHTHGGPAWTPKAAAIGFAAVAVAVVLGLLVAALNTADKLDPATPPETETPPWWSPGRFLGALLIAVVGAVIGGLIVGTITH
jgi:hypothetical protein